MKLLNVFLRNYYRYSPQPSRFYRLDSASYIGKKYSFESRPGAIEIKIRPELWLVRDFFLFDPPMNWAKGKIHDKRLPSCHFGCYLLRGIYNSSMKQNESSRFSPTFADLCAMLSYQHFFLLLLLARIRPFIPVGIIHTIELLPEVTFNANIFSTPASPPFQLPMRPRKTVKLVNCRCLCGISFRTCCAMCIRWQYMYFQALYAWSHQKLQTQEFQGRLDKAESVLSLRLPSWLALVLTISYFGIGGCPYCWNVRQLCLWKGYETDTFIVTSSRLAFFIQFQLPDSQIDVIVSYT